MSTTTNKVGIEGLLARNVEVDVDGITLTLAMPNKDILAEVRSKSAHLASIIDDGIDENGLNTMFDFNVFCVAAVLGVTEEDGLAALMVSGGEQGELFRATQKLLGISGDKESDASIDNPT